MKSPFVVVYWEGGLVERVSFSRWLHFIVTPNHKMALPNPGSAMPSMSAKCFAGLRIGQTYWGYDFIVPRVRKELKINIKPFVEWRGGKLTPGYQ